MFKDLLDNYEKLVINTIMRAGINIAPQQEKRQTVVEGVKEIGRNDPCPCGSGKKYKKCCGRDK